MGRLISILQILNNSGVMWGMKAWGLVHFTHLMGYKPTIITNDSRMKELFMSALTFPVHNAWPVPLSVYNNHSPTRKPMVARMTGLAYIGPGIGLLTLSLSLSLSFALVFNSIQKIGSGDRISQLQLHFFLSWPCRVDYFCQTMLVT